MPPRRRSSGDSSGRSRRDRSDLVRFVLNFGKVTNDPSLAGHTVDAIRQAAKRAGFKASNDLLRGAVNTVRGRSLTANQARVLFGATFPDASFTFEASVDGITGTIRIQYSAEIQYDLRFLHGTNQLADRQSVVSQQSIVQRFVVGRDQVDAIVQEDVDGKLIDIVSDDLKDAQETSFIADTETIIRSVRLTLGQVSLG